MAGIDVIQGARALLEGQRFVFKYFSVQLAVCLIQLALELDGEDGAQMREDAGTLRVKLFEEQLARYIRCLCGLPTAEARSDLVQ